MLTLFGTYILAIAIGAGCAIINDLFFIVSLKHHKLKALEYNILRQLNSIQLALILWVILVEITMFAIQIQTISLSTILGVSIAKFLIELVILFSVLLLRQVHMPALHRHQHTYGHLSESFVEHTNGLIGTCVTSMVSWFFIVFITSSEMKEQFVDFGFTTTIIIYVITVVLANWLFIFMKNRILHRRKHHTVN